MKRAWPLPWGAELTSAETTRFAIWAPGSARMSVALEGRLWPMEAGPDGFFRCELACGPGTAYQFVTDSGQPVPDPMSRLQQSDVDGPSLVVDPRSWTWHHPHWRGRPWREMVIQELHAGCLEEGGFSAVTAWLPRLQRLGITAIELMPVAATAGARNWGYDGVLPFAPNRHLGSPDELKQLVDTAHGLGLCVYLDVVYNHFGPRGNWLPHYAPEFFLKDSDSPWGQRIDFSQPRVREFFLANALYWLMEYRFDGLRLDAVHAIDDPGFLQELARSLRRQNEPGREIHLMVENEHNQAELLAPELYNAQWNDDAHNALHVILTGESEGYYAPLAAAPTARLARCLGEGFGWQGEPWPGPGDPPRGSPSTALPPTAFIFFLQNHDQVGNRALGERLTHLVEPLQLRAAMALQLLCPHIPLLFMGEEWGADTPFLFFTDFDGELAEAVRHGRRQEFAEFSAFADAEQRRHIPDPNDESSWQRSRLQLPPELAGEVLPPPVDPARAPLTATGWWQFCQGLLTLRRERLVPHLDRCRSLGARALGEGVLTARWQLGRGRQLALWSNLSTRPHRCVLPASACLVSSSPLPAAGDRLPAATTAAWLWEDHGPAVPEPEPRASR